MMLRSKFWSFAHDVVLLLKPRFSRAREAEAGTGKDFSECTEFLQINPKPETKAALEKVELLLYRFHPPRCVQKG